MTVPLRAALYLRVSTARQAEHDVSIPDQKRQGEAYCQSRGYQLVETFVEPGASATNDRRPEFQRMIEAGTSKSVSDQPEGVTQGLMFARLDGFAREPSQRNMPLVDIDLLATAPWNRARLVERPQFKGVGQLLLGTAVSLSVHEEFAGRIGLHALPQAESWYRDVCGMTDLGVDSTGMTYFEMTEPQARAFIR